MRSRRRGGATREEKGRRGRRGLARHLEGWQPAALAVLLAGSVALLVVPRPAPPTLLPAPLIAPREAARQAEEDAALARAAEAIPLDVDVRALGSALRAFGRASAGGTDDELVAARLALGKAAARASARPAEELVRLRAYQLETFLREVRRFVATGEASRELVELGGVFAQALERSAWLEREPRRLAADDAALRAAYKEYWNQVAGLEAPELALSPLEAKALLRQRLLRPSVELRAGGAGSRPPSPSERVALEGKSRLRRIEELAKLDPAYPAAFARGVVHFQLGHYELAAKHFADHLDAHPDGPLALRARNHLVAARLGASGR